MGINTTSRLSLAFLLLTAFTLHGAPILKLTINAIGPVSMPVGGTLQATTVSAFNVGDGTLNLTAASAVPWIVPTVGPPDRCGLFAMPCIPVDFKVSAASLSAGKHTGLVTISDPNAIDAPQFVSITVVVGGAIPDTIDLYAPPGNVAASTTFTTNSVITSTVTTTSGSNWLSITQIGSGIGAAATADIPTYLYKVEGNPAGLAQGTYSGTLKTVGGASHPYDTKTVPVTLHVTSQPIAAAAPDAVGLRIAAGSAKQTSGFQVNNAGSGTLTVSGVTPSGNPTWLTTNVNNNFVQVTADPAGLQPGTYTTTLAVASNAANSSLNVPVTFDVPAASPPVASAQGAVVNQVWTTGDYMAPGTIVALFGQQFTTGTSLYASAVPLPTQLGTTRVLVNGIAAPLFFISYNQIDFQLPFETQTGNAIISVERDGQQGNSTYVQTVANSPKVLRWGVDDYAVALNLDNTLVVPAALGGRPAKAGDVILIWGTGPGQSTPPLATGAGGPSTEPLARIPNVHVRFGPRVFGASVVVTPDFAGYAPGLVGSMQVNVRIPADAPKGDAVPVDVEYGDISNPIPGNYVTIAIQ